MTRYSTPLPQGSRLTSQFGDRGGTLHAGTDYGAPTPGQTGVPVYAVSSGRVEVTGFGDGSRYAEVAPYHSGRACLINHGDIGGDEMRTYYGHLARLDVSTGENVKAGEQIGIMGGSGPEGENHFAIHLHLGVSQNAARPYGAATSAGDPGWIDPNVWLTSKGITVGSDSPLDPDDSDDGDGGTGDPGGTHIMSTDKLNWRLDRAGYNRVEHLRTRVGAYQRQQLHGDLYVDGYWGHQTENHYQWVHDLQEAMNEWKGDDVPKDGDYRSVTDERVWDLQRRNEGGAYDGVVDGVPGPVFCSMLGIPTHPNL